tara:strand:- start:16613 stop:18808 length:2196 start_codon:yes stop_codon:yes gene_type:complete
MKKSKLWLKINLSVLSIGVYLTAIERVDAQFTQMEHKSPSAGVIPITKPGNYSLAGATYMLMNNISSPMSAIFLGKDVTLDLNGYSITFADLDYGHVPNFSFEQGLLNWDLSKAPKAKIEDTKVHVFDGDKVLRLSQGEEIVSEYIELPLAERSYVAMCGVATFEMRVSVYVEDEKGNSVVCNTRYRDGVMQSSPIIDRSPRLGGGFVYAHLTGLKAGKYRIRVKAETDCLIDHVDIRPAMDVGIGIVGKTNAMGHNDHLYDRNHTAFFDYTEDASLSTPISGVPVVQGRGSVVIKNGVIKNGTPGAISWGVQSTADDVMVVLENVKIINSGINSTAADLLQATITHCTFDVKNPFIINRHGSEFYAVDLRGEEPSEVSFSEFYGGQGCLVFKGDFSKIHHNFFVNRQTVTNHYSIMAMGDSSLIFDNVIKPEIGSGIEVFRHNHMEIFNNEIHIGASPPTSEYGHEEYSVNAIRVADYNAEPGSANGSFENKIYNNRIYIEGKDYPQYPDYIPMAYAVFLSASAGENYFFGNEIEVNENSIDAKNETAAFYVGGGTLGGQFFNNIITTNVPAIWVASPYGGAKNTRFINNKIIKSNSASEKFRPIRMGWEKRADCVAEDIYFGSNEVVGAEFGLDETMQAHNYSVYWTLNVKVLDKSGRPINGEEVKVIDANKKDIITLRTSEDGSVSYELLEYLSENSIRKYSSPYKIKVGKKSKIIHLNENKSINIEK